MDIAIDLDLIWGAVRGDRPTGILSPPMAAHLIVSPQRITCGKTRLWRNRLELLYQLSGEMVIFHPEFIASACARRFADSEKDRDRELR